MILVAEARREADYLRLISHLAVDRRHLDEARPDLGMNDRWLSWAAVWEEHLEGPDAADGTKRGVTAEPCDHRNPGERLAANGSGAEKLPGRLQMLVTAPEAAIDVTPFRNARLLSLR